MDGLSQRDWEREYEQMLMAGIAGGRVHMLPAGSEQRRHPRFMVDAGRILVTEQVPYDVVDLSISGMAFYSAKAFPVGNSIQVSVRSLIAIEAVVLGSEALAEPEAPDSYKVRCRFIDPEYGLRFLMLALEMESGRVEAVPA